MSLLLIIFTFIFTAAALLAPHLIPWSIRLVGIYLQQKTKGRKELLLSRATESQEGNTILQEKAEEDSDWEKISRNIPSSAKNGGIHDTIWHGIVGFFHPFCNAGGGGERVLWAAIRASQDRWPLAVCVVYTGDHDAEKEAIIKRVEERFNIKLNPHTLHFMYLSTRRYVLASTWPRFTLLGQSIGSVILALDAFNLLVPDIYIDTMGYAFTLALSKFLFPKVPTGAYVHYPTISTDMLSSLDSTDSDEQGLHAGAGKGFKGYLKKNYWILFAKAYSWAGVFVDVVMTNSSWTRGHIEELWGTSRLKRAKRLQKPVDEISVVFPPVAVSELENHIEVSASNESSRLRHILYIAQFRPEKNHTLIINAFAELINSQEWEADKRPRLVLVGSVRDRDDSGRVYKLRLLAHELQIKEDVEFVCDASWETVLQHLRESTIGVNGMWNEHFGIGVVEYQASGLISVVNDSGGPKMDIVVNVDGGATGFHASSVEEYAAAFGDALNLSSRDSQAMRLRARKSAQRFSEEVFAAQWVEQMARLVAMQQKPSW